MKARITHSDNDRVLMSRAGIKQIVEQEFTNKQYELYNSCARDITIQVLSNVLNTLEYWYGWKKDRLKKFIEQLHKEEDDMVQLGVSTIDNVRRIKEKFGIDLIEEFPDVVVERKEP